MQSLTLSLGAAAGQPGSNGKSVTISFRTQTVLANENSIIITWPNGYLSPTSGAQTVVYSGPASTFSGVTVSSTAATITVGTATAPPGSYTITLTGLTIGSPIQSQRCNMFVPALTGCISAVTTTDRVGFSSYPSIQPRGQVTAVSVDVLQTDRVPDVSKPVTISFTTQTDLTSVHTITM